MSHLRMAAIVDAVRLYLPQAERTEKVLPLLAALRHGVLGLITETGELADTVKKFVIYEKPLDEANVLEELGDIFWYAAVLMNNLDFNTRPPTVPPYVNELSKIEGLQHSIHMIALEVGRLAQSVEWFSKSGDRSMLTTEVSDGMSRLIQHIISLSLIANVNMVDALSANIAKLRARYPEKYSNADALARADKVV